MHLFTFTPVCTAPVEMKPCKLGHNGVSIKCVLKRINAHFSDCHFVQGLLLPVITNGNQKQTEKYNEEICSPDFPYDPGWRFMFAFHPAAR